jgi:hypothetical protein
VVLPPVVPPVIPPVDNTPPSQESPEPATIGLALVGVGLAYARRKKS